MGELSLDLKPSTTTTPTPTPTSTYTPKPIGLFLNEISRISNVSEKLSKVDGYVKCLEEEMKKIDAFKRELPLCMLLLNDAIVSLKCQVMQLKSPEVEPVVLNKFVPYKDNEKENDLKDKKSWMSSVQLWSSNDKHNSSSVEQIAKEEDRSESIFPRNGGGGGAFVPFKGFSGLQTRKEEKENDDGIQLESGLSLVPPGIKKPSSSLVNSKSCGGNRSISPSSTENSHSSGPIQLQTQGPRKQRRCWSPDLHRRFLNALQQLGGSQVATPKQIRELMKVEGLTNDEVKSHLQKYRLHSRRYPASASASATASAPAAENQKLALFGGLWAQPQDQCGTSKASVSQSESPQGPLQLMGTSGGTSTTGDDSMDEEDGKSESYNWKGHFYKPGEDAA